ncbi:MAG: bestrophin family protein [Bryobacteraceae bacterium]
MHAGRNYSFKEISAWTRRESFVFLLIAAVPTLLFILAGWTWITLPWQPMAVVGTAVAFITGFKNNASYSRLWEARQAWGGIINGSRAWSLLVFGFLPNDASARQRLLYRHIAWVTALRFQLREPRKWENMERNANVEYRKHYRIAEWQDKIEDILRPLLSPDECQSVLARKGRATLLIALQGRDLRQLYTAGALTEMHHIELQRTLTEFIDLQGKCERIKNFPYPRQFATLNHLFVWTFIILVPFGLLPEFHRMGPGFAWVTIPASVVLAWIFHTMDKIGTSSENPFEGSPNDVPITAMSRTIEIDLRQALDETEIPPALEAENNILM